MELAHDILRLADKVAQVPGLSAACSLAMFIMKTVQISKNNTARLQYLAHMVVDHLVSLAEHMEGKWDNVSDRVKELLDEYENVLRSIIEVVTKHLRTSRMISLINASDRDLEISQVERRLADVQRSMLILLGMDASAALHNLGLGMNQILSNVDTHRRNTLQRIESSLSTSQQRILETRSGVLRLENASERGAPRAGTHDYDDLGLQLYARHNLHLLRKIGCIFKTENGLTITLYEAQERGGGRVVLVKKYEGSDSNKRQEKFSQDLSMYTNVWCPTVLQVIGASTAASQIPFQVYSAPDGRVEGWWDWLARTQRSNPVETICGLYDMRTSIKALAEFQANRHVYCRWPFLSSVVNVRTNGSRVQWALIYTGEIEDGNEPWKIHDLYQMFRLGDTSGVVDAFCEASETWAEGAQFLDALLERGIQNVDMATLGTALFENGWLPATGDYIQPTTVGLGDVGYMTADTRFVVV